MRASVRASPSNYYPVASSPGGGESRLSAGSDFPNALKIYSQVMVFSQSLNLESAAGLPRAWEREIAKEINGARSRDILQAHSLREGRISLLDALPLEGYRLLSCGACLDALV